MLVSHNVALYKVVRRSHRKTEMANLDSTYLELWVPPRFGLEVMSP